MAFEILMMLAMAHFFRCYNPKELADFLEIPHQQLYVNIKDWSCTIYGKSCYGLW